MCASVLLLYVCLLLNLSVRTVSHPSLAVKHWSLTSLIRPLLNHLSVCLTVCSLFSISSVALASIWAPDSSPPVLHQAYLHLSSHSAGSRSLPLFLHSLRPALVRGVGEYNRVNHSHSEAVSLSIHRTAEAWNMLSSSTYHHAASILTRHTTQSTTQLHTILLKSITISVWQQKKKIGKWLDVNSRGCIHLSSTEQHISTSTCAS